MELKFNMTYECWWRLKPAEKVIVLVDQFGMSRAEAEKLKNVADAHDLPHHEAHFRHE